MKNLKLAIFLIWLLVVLFSKQLVQIPTFGIWIVVLFGGLPILVFALKKLGAGGYADIDFTKEKVEQARRQGYQAGYHHGRNS